MANVARTLVLSRLLLVAGAPVLVSACDSQRPDGSESGTTTNHHGDGDGDGDEKKPLCELISRTELADADEVAPNGRSGSEILAAVPESLRTALHWDFSTTTGIEVEIPGSVGLSTGFDISFSFPSEPQFFFEDMEVAVPEPNVAVTCYDYVLTTVDIHMETDDGTILADLTEIPIRLGPDFPGAGAIAESLAYADVVMATPAVNFLKPEPLVANMDKTISILFDGLSTEGSIIVYAEGSSATYQHLVARW